MHSSKVVAGIFVFMTSTEIKLIDTHTHLYLDQFDDDREEVMIRCFESGIETILLPNINFIYTFSYKDKREKHWMQEKKIIAMLGGGQLGLMFTEKAQMMGEKVLILDPDPDCPAGKIADKFINADYLNIEALKIIIDNCDVCTTEFENIPYEALNEMNKLKSVLPKPSVNRLIQHRLAEKDFINKLNIRTTRYTSIEKKSDLETLEDFLPGILKTTTMGYDGKGQFPIKRIEELEALKIDFSKGYMLEKLVKLKKEISVIITRFGNNDYQIYDPIENIHQDQILKHSKIPAEISKIILSQSKDWATQIAEELKYIGTLCVEFFIDRNENLYVNEIAPRVHNSGHLTINAYNISQFENHVRAVCSLEQIPLNKISNAEMINLIGDQIIPYRNNPEINDNQFFFDYFKKEIKEKRKMGHLTTLK